MRKDYNNEISNGRKPSARTRNNLKNLNQEKKQNKKENSLQ